MQVIGFIRFSYPALGGFQVEHDSIADREAHLYADHRLAQRFALFEGLCLPSLRAQTDPDFTLVVLIGDGLPARWRDRLETALRDVPQARVAVRPPAPHRKICQDVINAHRTPGVPCLQFRHDDDDAVCLDFVALLRAAARDCAALLTANPLVGFDWNRGYVVRPDAEGLCGAETVTPYWGVAQAIAAQPDTALTVMNFAHAKINRFMPTVTFTQPHAYLRGHNDHNDSRQGKPPDALPRFDRAAEQMLAARFGVDADAIRRLMRAL